MRRPELTLLFILGLSAASGACTDDEISFNEIERLRVLGIQSSPPWLLEGQTAALQFLSVNNDPNIDDADLRTRWSFCPLQADSTLGFQCLITSVEDLEVLTGTVALPPEFELAEFSEFGLLISTSSTAVLPFVLPAETISTLCDMIDEVDLPPFVTRPECNGRFPITVFLERGPFDPQSADPDAVDPDRRVIAFRDVDLVYDPTLETNPPNQNPEISSLSVSRAGEQDFVLTSTAAPIVLRYDTVYDLRIDVTPDQAEDFESGDDDEPNREQLTVTWFIEGGETEFTRTGFLPADDGDSFADLIDNEWTTPSSANFEGRTEAQLFLVIRDGRGGQSWIVRDVQFDDVNGL